MSNFYQLELPTPDAGDTEQSVAERKTYLGGHDVAAVCGVHPHLNAVEVWNEKRSTNNTPGGITETMHWGRRLEDVIVDELLARLDSKGSVEFESTQRGVFARHPLLRFLGGTADFVGVVKADGNHSERERRVVIEAKNVGPSQVAEWADGPPLHVVYQIQHYMAIHNAGLGYVAALFNGREFKAWAVHRDASIVSQIIDKASDFWHENVILGVPPTLQEETLPETREGIELLDDPEGMQILRDYVAAKIKASATSSDAERLSELLRDRSKGLPLLVGGKAIGTWQTTSRAAYTVEAKTTTSFRLARSDVIRKIVPID